MKIWILTNEPTSYENLKYKEEAKKYNLILKIVKESEFEIFADAKNADQIFYKGEPVVFPDVLLVRTGASTTYFQFALVREFEENGVFVLNSSISIKKAKDKLYSLQILSEKFIPFPKTLLAKFPFNYEVIESRFSYPLILKKVAGSGGKGVFLIKDREHLEEVEELLSEGDKKNNFIFQEYLKKSKGMDIRVFVLGGKVIGAMKRSANKGFRANVSQGGKSEFFKVTLELEWLALETTRALGLSISGVDILFDDNGYKVCEVNSNPGFKGFESATGINIPAKVFEFLKARTGIII